MAYTTKIYIIKIAQFEFLSVSRARSAIHRATFARLWLVQSIYCLQIYQTNYNKEMRAIYM